MRRLSDTYDAHSRLSSLSDTERLFVLRWIELFDESTPLLLRASPTTSKQLESEFASDAARGFNQRLLVEEMEWRSSLLQSDLADAGDSRIARRAEFYPVSSAESLGRQASAAGFHHQWLFRAYSSLLPQTPQEFSAALDSQISTFEQQKEPRSLSVAVPAEGARPEQAVRPGVISLCATNQLQPPHRSALARARQPEAQTKWWVTSIACTDPAAAWDLARERLESAQKATQPRRRLEFDSRITLVDDPAQQPLRQGFAFRPARTYRFPVPLWTDEFERLAGIARESDGILDQLLSNFQAAAYYVTDDDVRAAFNEIVKCQDIAFSDYRPPTHESSHLPARRFVFRSAGLLALNWPHDYFTYLYDYLVRPSSRNAGGIDLLEGERRRSVVWEMIRDQREWERIHRRCPWDALVAHRRNSLLSLTRSPRAVLIAAERNYRWELARAVRQRNQMFHQGTPLRDAQQLAVVLAAVQLNIRLRVFSHHSAKPFGTLVQAARRALSQRQTTGQRIEAFEITGGWNGVHAFVGGLEGELRDSRRPMKADE